MPNANPTETQSTEVFVMSVNDIPEIQRRKSEQLTEILEKVHKLKPSQVLCVKVNRTKPSKKHPERGPQLNRQFAFKVSNQLGQEYTVQTRMGVADIKQPNGQVIHQDVNELYLYIFKTPTQTPTA